MKSYTENKVVDIEELEILLNSLRPYKFVFKRSAESIPETIVIKLNAAKTRIVIIIPNHNEFEVQDDSQIFNSITYGRIRTELQNSVRKLGETELIKQAEEQILIYFKRHNLLEDREGFLVDFNDFLNTLPEVSPELQGYLGELASLNLDDVDIDSLDENDPALKRLGELHQQILSHLDSYRDIGAEYLRKRNKSEEEKATEDSDIIDIAAPEFMKSYPNQSKRLEKIFQILNDSKIEEHHDQLDKIALALKTDKKKLRGYFQARTTAQVKSKKETIGSEVTHAMIASSTYWYSDDDIDRLGQRLEKYGVNVEKQFKGRLTKDIISSLPAAEDIVDAEGDTIRGLEEGKPIFISYNIGGNAASYGGEHWVAICLVKHGGIVKVLYKDSKGDFKSNAAVVESKFRVHYDGSGVEFIRHTGVEQEDDSSCGPMTVSNLERMAKKIEDEGINALVNGFSDIAFIRQDEVTEVRSEHAKLFDEIVQDETNIFVKHLKARQVVLGVYLGNIDSLISQIEGPEALKDGIIIDTKIPRYLSKLDPKLDHEKQLKEAITDKEVNELEYVGMNSIIQMREVHDVSDEVIENAQWQIAGGLAALALTIPFPFLLPISGPIAGALIGEGITDIVMALIDQGQAGFDKKDYTKGKLISYGISIVTMGIGAIASSTKILTKAMNACKSLANKLRAVEGPFAKVCNWMAGKLDKLANYLELSIKKIEMAKKSMDAQKQMLTEMHKEASAAQKLGDVEKYKKLTKQLQQLDKLKKVSDITVKHSQQLIQILKTTATGALKGVAMSVAMAKIFTAALNNIMAGLKPQIEEKVKVAVALIINAEQARLAKYTQERINKQIQAVFETSLNEDIEHVVKEISLGVLRHSNNWKMQLAVLALDSLISGIDIATCADKICSKFLAALPVLPEEALSYQHNYKQIISRLGVRISDMVYGKIVAITGKVVVTLPKDLYRGYKQHKEKIADKQAVELMKQRIEKVNSAEKSTMQKNTGCVHNAVAATLSIDNEHLAHSAGLAMSTEGASKEDIIRLYAQNGIATTECSVIDAVEQLEKCESDRAVVCLQKDGDSIGHAMPVTLEGRQLMVTEKGQKISLDVYRAENGYSDATIIVPHRVNAEKIADGSISRITNHNRIAKVAHSIEFVGGGGRVDMYGKKDKPGSKKAQDVQRKQDSETKRQQETKANDISQNVETHFREGEVQFPIDKPPTKQEKQDIKSAIQELKTLPQGSKQNFVGDSKSGFRLEPGIHKGRGGDGSYEIQRNGITGKTTVAVVHYTKEFREAAGSNFDLQVKRALQQSLDSQKKIFL